MAQDFSNIQLTGEPLNLQSLQQSKPTADYSQIELSNEPINPNDVFSGFTSSQPLNQSDLDTADRFKMGFGNEKGNIEYLKQKGYDAKINDKGDLVYRKPDDKLWRYVDEKNSWSLSEMVKDVAEASPEIASFMAQTGAVALSPALAGAGILASGAAAAGIGGIVKAAATSFGRHYKTYSDDPENQVKDIAVETLLSGLGGGAGRALELGAKPTLKWVASNLGKMADNITVGGETVKNIATFLTKVGLGVPDDAAELIVTKAAKISKTLDEFAPTANSKTISEGLDIKNISATQKLVNYYKKASEVIYKQDKRKILQAAEEQGLPFDPATMADDLLTQLGPIFKIKVLNSVDPATGKQATRYAANMQQALLLKNTSNSKIKLDLIDNEGIAKLLEEGIVEKDLKKVALGQLLSNETGRKTLQDGMDRVLPNILAFNKRSGAEAAESFMEFGKLFREQLWDMRSSAVAADNQSLAKMFAGMHDSIETVFSAPLDKVSNNLYSQMNQTYRVMRHGLSMFDDTARLYAVDKNAYAKLYNQMKANSTLGTARREMLGSVDDVLAQRMPHLKKRIDGLTEAIDVNLAAKHFAPWINPSIAKYAVGVGGGIGLATGDPSAAMGIGGMALLTSPRLAAKAFGAAAHGFQGANSHIAKQIAQFPEAIKGLQTVKGFASNLSPNALKGANRAAAAETLNSMLNNYIMAPQIQQQQQQQLLQQGGVR